MDRNTYLGSFAQEDVVFQTIVSETSSYGENFQRMMMFIDYANVVDASAFVAVSGSDSVKAATVTADTYASIVSGAAQSWLTDFFASGTTQEAYVIICGEDADALTTAAMTAAYEILKPYAYWKVVCPTILADATADPAIEADPASISETRLVTLASALADLCVTDKQVLSGPVPVPLSTADASAYASDTVFTSLKTKFVFMSYHPDTTRNAALFSIGLALATLNTSGTSIGNSLDMTKTTNITTSGVSRTLRNTMSGDYIQTWKPVGDNSSNVAAKGDRTLTGDVIGALWIVAYVTYMSKVQIAVMMTVPNFYKNASNYARILGVLQANLTLFTGRLTAITITAPSFAALPASASDELVIPDAWTAQYRDHLRTITISGTLYIGE